MTALIILGVLVILIIAYRFLENARKRKEENDEVYQKERIRRIRQMNKTTDE